MGRIPIKKKASTDSGVLIGAATLENCGADEYMQTITNSNSVPGFKCNRDVHIEMTIKTECINKSITVKQ